MRRQRFAALCFVFAGVQQVAQPLQQDLRELFEAAPRTPPPPSGNQAPKGATSRSASVSNDRIDPILRRLLQEPRAKSASDRRRIEVRARGLGAHVEDGRVAVRIHVGGTGDVEPLSERVKKLRGEVTDVFETLIFATVPLDKIEELSRDAEVYFVAAQTIIEPLFASTAVSTSGVDVQAILADRLHARGVNGLGVKVGILDFGFADWGSLQRKGALPPSKADGLFNAELRIENGNSHGTVCGEIIHAMAPGAEIYRAVIGAPGGGAIEGQFIRAAFWLAKQGVDIINFSGGTPIGPGDDRNTLARVVNDISKRFNILWVVASGNEARQHWLGNAVDRDGDGWIDIGHEGQQSLILRAHSNRVRVLVRWDDWGSNPLFFGATEDLDVFLYSWDPGRKHFQLVAAAETRQRGVGPPMEIIDEPAKAGQIYALRLKAYRVTRPFKIHIFSASHTDMYPVVAESSLLSPAVASQALAVGAIDIRSKLVDIDSSQGPTDDARLAPTVCAPSSAISSVGGQPFAGTSASSAYAAGFAALIKHVSPQARGARLHEQLRLVVQPIGPRRPNNECGYGFIHADQLAKNGISAPGQSGTLQLPAQWGGTVSMAALNRVLRHGLASQRSLTIRLAGGRDGTYRIGDGMKIGLRSSEDCHCLLLLRDSKESYTLLSTDETTRLQHDVDVILPRKGPAITIQNPSGLKDVVTICADQPFALDREPPQNRRLAANMWRFEVRD